MIIVLDYGMGNPGSILNMIRKVGGDALISASPLLISKAEALILPGVGSFDNGMQKLQSSGLIEVILERVIYGKIYFLGICLGMQLLFNYSDEGEEKGLGLIQGSVKRFNFSQISNNKIKIPHMGWNTIKLSTMDDLFSGLEDSRFYFLHSYHADCEYNGNILATSEYGYEFICAVKSNNIYGVQFHPEKSHRFGMTFFRNYLEIIS